MFPSDAYWDSRTLGKYKSTELASLAGTAMFTCAKKTVCLFFAQKCLRHEQTFRISRTGIFNCVKIAMTKQGVSRNGDPDLVQSVGGYT